MDNTAAVSARPTSSTCVRRSPRNMTYATYVSTMNRTTQLQFAVSWIPNSLKRRSAGSESGSSGLSNSDARTVANVRNVTRQRSVRQDEVQHQQRRQQDADDQHDAAQVADHVCVLAAIGGERLGGWRPAGCDGARGRYGAHGGP